MRLLMYGKVGLDRMKTAEPQKALKPPTSRRRML